ncbi:FAD-dependent oxidoreductase [Novosphingobium sp. RL4]|uniref:ferredoxin--NADP reductase n=1 Tax=Novosphingobium sp. RL4 TaxID=3109595 RepID=UPI002D7A2320|nr:FAD-dependent oxidoreductase [Novosphingobium sp. RL4]WRT91728.1 FAD-dependent oxidoreductase [Novosphingobium sp. RL4]
MPRIIHPVAGLIALLTIATFWLSTVISELFLSEAAVVAVKTTLPWGFLLLVPALAAAGGSGFFLSHGQRTGLVGAKLKRMPFIAANGLLILIPAALFLASKARAGEFDTVFYVVQAVELIAGATNITLLGLGMRDGMKLTQWRRGNFLRPAAGYKTTLAGKEEVARGTVAFRLKKPAGFTHAAGQAVYVTLPGQKEADSKGRVRTFSLASAPQEPELVIATRMTDTAFKRCLADLPAGSPVGIEGPYGDLTLDGGTTPVVFLAGGIGITPFRSMILDAVGRGLSRDVTLFYSNRSAADAAYLPELEQLASSNPRFKLVATMTDAADWQGERGFIDRPMIERHAGDITAPVFYLAGPPAMVAAMEALLLEAGVRSGNIRAEVFTGY